MVKVLLCGLLAGCWRALDILTAQASDSFVAHVCDNSASDGWTGFIRADVPAF